jgi:hypothetical protein
MGYTKLRSSLIYVVTKAREAGLPEPDMQVATEYIEYKEYGLALEHIATQLYEFSLPISIEVFKDINKCAELMQMPEDKFYFLKEIVR